MVGVIDGQGVCVGVCVRVGVGVGVRVFVGVADGVKVRVGMVVGMGGGVGLGVSSDNKPEDNAARRSPTGPQLGRSAIIMLRVSAIRHSKTTRAMSVIVSREDVLPDRSCSVGWSAGTAIPHTLSDPPGSMGIR